MNFELHFEQVQVPTLKTGTKRSSSRGLRTEQFMFDCISLLLPSLKVKYYILCCSSINLLCISIANSSMTEGFYS